MDYQVLVVEDDQLPCDTDWVLAREGERCFLMIKRCRFSSEGELCALLSEVWATRVEAQADGRLDGDGDYDERGGLV